MLSVNGSVLATNQDNLRVDIEKLLRSDELTVPPPFVSDVSFSGETFANKSRLSKSVIVDTLLGKPYRYINNRRVRHQVLDKHLTIAWDLDQTLIGGPQSWFWRRWIRDNYKAHKFWIMTFRSANDANRIWDDLTSCRDPLDPNWFEGIRIVDPVLWDAWIYLREPLQDLDHESKLTPALQELIKQRKLEIDLIISINRAIRAWKAIECRKHNCTLLVEDRESFCKPYCDALGIQFLNALTD